MLRHWRSCGLHKNLSDKHVRAFKPRPSAEASSYLPGCGESNSRHPAFPRKADSELSRGAENRTPSSFLRTYGSSQEPMNAVVGVRRIGLRHLAPKASVLPVYDTPTTAFIPRKRTFLLYDTPPPVRRSEPTAGDARRRLQRRLLAHAHPSSFRALREMPDARRKRGAK